MPPETPRGAAAPDEALDVALLAERFVEQRQPGVTVDEVRSLFEHLLATVYTGATITQYLPVLLWRQAMDRWPARATQAAPA
jgi:hypothetical protein